MIDQSNYLKMNVNHSNKENNTKEYLSNKTNEHILNVGNKKLSDNLNDGVVFTCDLCARLFNHDYNLRKHTPACKKLSNEQSEILQIYFKESSSLSNEVTEKIVSEANLSIKTVQYWYAEIQNREALLGKNSDRLFGQIHE